MATDSVSPDPFEPDDFWEAHKAKIIAYGAVFLIAVGGWGAYEYRQQSRITASEEAFAVAKTAEDFRAISEQYAGTPAGGNATLELAAKLREEGKYDETVALLNTLLAKETRYPLLAGGWTSLAATKELQGQIDEAIAIYADIAAKFPQESAASLALASQARLLAGKGDIEGATRIYQDLTVRYPESVFAMNARLELQLLKQQTPAKPAATPEATPAATPEAAE